jgi:hypothetical protein
MLVQMPVEAAYLAAHTQEPVPVPTQQTQAALLEAAHTVLPHQVVQQVQVQSE